VIVSCACFALGFTVFGRLERNLADQL
jgi:hypothetical protein